MFTGIVREVGTVGAVDERGGGARIRLTAAATAAGASLGDSVAVAGCCLTVVERSGDALAFDLVAETLRRTTLGGLRPGGRVNLEPALRVGEPMGGHWVQGHVDGVGRVRARREEGGGAVVAVDAPEAVLRLTAEKGSVCLDGVSLTVAGVDDDGFEVALVPHTLAVTTLGRLATGDPVNLEADILARYVERLARAEAAA